MLCLASISATNTAEGKQRTLLLSERSSCKLSKVHFHQEHSIYISSSFIYSYRQQLFWNHILKNCLKFQLSSVHFSLGNQENLPSLVILIAVTPRVRMVAEMVIASTFSMSLMSMTEIHLCVPFSKNNNLGKKKIKNTVLWNHQRHNIAWRGWGRNALISRL